jgi:hypothetical protein
MEVGIGKSKSEIPVEMPPCPTAPRGMSLLPFETGFIGRYVEKTSSNAFRIYPLGVDPSQRRMLGKATTNRLGHAIAKAIVRSHRSASYLIRPKAS